MIELYPNPWRAQFEGAVSGVQSELMLAAPYIKAAEAETICDLLGPPTRAASPRVRVLTDLRAESALRGSLDLAALQLFQNRCPGAEVTTLPSLHAKVYVFDRSLAVVTSANLTRGGLDSNYEYGVGIRDRGLIETIVKDIDAYARLGSLVSPEVVDDLSRVAAEAATQYNRVVNSATREARERFAASLRHATVEFSRALVGHRSAHAFFCDAILFALRNGPLPTRRLHPVIQQLLPDLCDDSEEVVINGQRFGKTWKHHVRGAQVSLRRGGKITLREGKWGLAT